MLTACLFLIVCFLAYSNGANDNFKGVASLYGSGTAKFRSALAWATVTVAAGSLTALFVAGGLLKKFSGKGLVPDALTTNPLFLLTVALAAGSTVMLATRLGFPISTTHGLTGALVGAGMVAAPGRVNFATLGTNFVMPLLLAPVLAVVTGALFYTVLRGMRRGLGVKKESCLCVGAEAAGATFPSPEGALTLSATPQVTATTGTTAECAERYTGRMLGINAATAVDALHFLSAGAVGFARGLNDTPKIAALLLVAGGLQISWGIIAVAVAMALGGILQSARVAHTMSRKLTGMNPGQGCAANLATAVLVSTANWSGLPVSTTHVSVGALVGQGIVARRVHWKPVGQVVLSWVITLPCAAAMAALVAWAVRLG